jgi:hypothetical protein
MEEGGCCYLFASTIGAASDVATPTVEQQRLAPYRWPLQERLVIKPPLL